MEKMQEKNAYYFVIFLSNTTVISTISGRLAVRTGGPHVP
jgi:hypothetical protein